VEIKICTAYHLKDHNGKLVETLTTFPADLGVFDGTSSRGKVELEYKTLPGWNTSIVGVTKWEELPANAQKYVEFIEQFCGTPIKYIGTGPKREDMIVR